MKQQLQDNGLDNPNLWTKEDDDYLWLNFMKKSDEELESELKVKPKSAIYEKKKIFGFN